MRCKLLSVVFAVLVALATAGVAAAGNGGFTPVTPASPNAVHTQHAYYLILGFTAAIFVLVEGLLVVFVVKYRSRGRSRAVEGAQVHGHTRLELIWTAFPVVILAIIAAFVFYELPSIRLRAGRGRADPHHGRGPPVLLAVRLRRLPGSGAFDRDAPRPRGLVVDLKVVSPDVIHSWWIPALGGKIQAIPGRINHFWFRADAPGSYDGQCAQLCGVFHASMRATVEAGSRQQYQHYLATWQETIGKQLWNGVCATCHGNLGQGGYGPRDRQQLGARPEVVAREHPPRRRHRLAGTMPPVGDTWTEAEINHLVYYVKRHIYKASAGATSGG